MKNTNLQCYFCQKEIFHTEDKINYYCYACCKGDIETIYTSYVANELVRAHIYFNNFHIRMNIRENNTDIFSRDELNFIIKLPGFPINLNNLSSRLSTILTFL